jgi:hypothetical protein
MYKVLRSIISDNGSNPDKAISDASDTLAQQVQAAEEDGWSPAGGVHTFSRQKPHGLQVWLMQAVTKAAAIEPATSTPKQQGHNQNKGKGPNNP